MLDKQLRTLINMLRLNPLMVEGVPIDRLRESLDNMGDKAPRISGISSEQIVVGGVNVCHFFPEEVSYTQKLMVYLHGGGYVMGSSRSHRPLLERLCLAFEGSVYSIDYSLAPEAPFPVALNEVLGVYSQILLAGKSAKKIVIAGDSAGGGLALASLINFREEGLEIPACGILISPWTDLAITGESAVSCASFDPIVKRKTLSEFGSMYLGGALPTTPLASPLYANFHGLCPLLLQVGGSEVLLDDSLRLQKKLESAAVTSELQVWDDVVHVWHLFAPILEKGKEAINDAAKYANAHVA